MERFAGVVGAQGRRIGLGLNVVTVLAMVAVSVQRAWAVPPVQGASYASDSAGCISAGYDYGVYQVAGDFKYCWKCKCNSVIAQASKDSLWYEKYTKTSLNFMNWTANVTSPTTDSTHVRMDNFVYTLQRGTVGGVPTFSTTLEGVTSGTFANSSIPGSLAASDIHIVPGQAGGGTYKYYKGLVVVPGISRCGALVLAVVLGLLGAGMLGIGRVTPPEA